MHDASELLDKFDGQLSSRRYDAAGEELLSSRIRRAVEAYALQQKLEADNPHLKAEREAAMRAGEEAQRRECMEAHEKKFWAGMESALRQMGLRDRELQVVAGMDESWPAWRAVAAWAASTGPRSSFLTIGGKGGEGKTIAACWLLVQKAREHVKCESFEGWFWRPAWGKFVKASELARFSYYDQNDRRYLERLGLVRWLVLDDLGTETMSDVWRSTVYDLLDTRARNQVRTIITTNCRGDASKGDKSIPSLKERYDTRVMRRLTDFGTFAAPARGGA